MCMRAYVSRRVGRADVPEDRAWARQWTPMSVRCIGTPYIDRTGASCLKYLPPATCHLARQAYSVYTWDEYVRARIVEYKIK